MRRIRVSIRGRVVIRAIEYPFNVLINTASRFEMPFSEQIRTETKPIPMKWQLHKNTNPFFILPKIPICNQILTRISQNTDKIPRKYQEIWDRNTKYRLGISIFLVYQFFCLRLASLLSIPHGVLLRTFLTIRAYQLRIGCNPR